MNRILSVFFVTIFSGLSFFSTRTLASEFKKTIPPLTDAEAEELPVKPELFGLLGPKLAEDLYNRTKFIVEKYFGFAPEPSYQSELNTYNNQQSLKGFSALYKYFDKQKQFGRFASFESQGSGVVHVHQDRDALMTEDFKIALAPTPLVKKPFENFHPTSSRPLAGLKIALDPGHMGSKIWDERTGKYVTDHHGHSLSEGVINLQTCLLLKDRFEKEGATVLITHDNLGPVTLKAWDGLNLQEYIPDEVYESTLEPWFIALLEKAPIGKDLTDAFATSPRIKKLFSESMRYDFFILKEDIDARAEKIKTFNPDVTLVIHYDTSDPKGDPNGVSPQRVEATKVYIAGAFEPTEFSSRAFRRDFAKHVFEPYWWQASAKLASALSLQLRTVLNLKGDKPYGEQVEVDEGVLTRNLSLTRQLEKSALAYVECLYYNDPVEFSLFLKEENPMTIDGASYPYSNRLKQVVDALETGVLNFASNMGGI